MLSQGHFLGTSCQLVLVLVINAFKALNYTFNSKKNKKKPCTDNLEAFNEQENKPFGEVLLVMEAKSM